MRGSMQWLRNGTIGKVRCSSLMLGNIGTMIPNDYSITSHQSWIAFNRWLRIPLGWLANLKLRHIGLHSSNRKHIHHFPLLSLRVCSITFNCRSFIACFADRQKFNMELWRLIVFSFCKWISFARAQELMRNVRMCEARARCLHLISWSFWTAV